MKGATSGTTTLLVADAVSPNITFPSATSTLATVSGALGTPTSGTLTNCTGLPATTGLVAGTANYKLFTNAAGTAPEWAAGINSTSTTYDVSTTGSLSITGIGFKPKAVIAIASLASTYGQSFGMSTGNAGYNLFNDGSTTSGMWLVDGSFIAVMRTAYGTQALLSFSSFDSDGATFTKSKSGSPTGTASIMFTFWR